MKDFLKFRTGSNFTNSIMSSNADRTILKSKDNDQFAIILFIQKIITIIYGQLATDIPVIPVIFINESVFKFVIYQI